MAAIVACAPGNVRAWGAAGHHAVCEIAYQELRENARKAVNAIMATEDDDEFKTFAAACNWPDKPGDAQRARDKDHYLNVPRHWVKIFQESCHQVPRCLFTGINEDEQTLRKRRASQAEKLIALKFLGHWIGDLHQPLHISFKDDRGGNEIELRREIGCAPKLHAVWDRCIPEELMRDLNVGSDRSAFGKALQRDITQAQRAAWTASMSLVDWANESYAITRQPDVRYCVLKGKRCDYSEDDAEYDADAHDVEKKVLELTNDYERAFVGVVKERIQQAGVRLGAMLNDIFDPR